MNPRSPPAADAAVDTPMLLGLLIAVTAAFPSMTPAKLFSVLGIGHGDDVGRANKIALAAVNVVDGVLQFRDRVLRAVAEALAGAGIDLPFPSQQILVHDQTEATDGDRAHQREGWPAGDNPPEPRPLNRIEPVRDAGPKEQPQ